MDWVVFDYTGVVSHPPGDEAFALVARELEVAPEVMWPAYWKGRESYDRGLVDAAGYWGEVCGHLGRVANAALLETLVALDLNAWSYLNRQTLIVAGELAERGMRPVLLANAPLELARLIDGQPWAALFQRRFFSADLQLVKPDPALFRAVYEELPGDVLFVDDEQESVEAAKSAGCDALLFADAGRLHSDLTG